MSEEQVVRIKESIDAAIARLRRRITSAGRREDGPPGMPADPVARAAVHEAGHALAAWASLYVRRITSVAVDGRGNGLTLYERDKDGVAQAWDGIVIGLGGLAAELAVFGRFRSGGSGDDLACALSDARGIRARDPVCGTVVACPWHDDASIRSPDFAAMFEHRPGRREVEILEISHRRARALIDMRRDLLVGVARAVLASGALDEGDIARIMGDRPWALHPWPA